VLGTLYGPGLFALSPLLIALPLAAGQPLTRLWLYIPVFVIGSLLLVAGAALWGWDRRHKVFGTALFAAGILGCLMLVQFLMAAFGGQRAGIHWTVAGPLLVLCVLAGPGMVITGRSLRREQKKRDGLLDISHPHCPVCKSNDVRKMFLGIPKVFAFGPGTEAVVLILLGVIAAADGWAKRPFSGRIKADWVIEVAIGLIVLLLGILRLVFKSHVCRSCGKRFNWPPFRGPRFEIKCPQCSALLKGLTDDLVGETAACSECNHSFTIERPSYF